MHFDVEDFPCALLNHQGPEHPSIPASREVEISDYAANALQLNEPPLKLLWFASRNITQDQNYNSWSQLLGQLELIVTVDLYMTKTAEGSDLDLLAASNIAKKKT